MKQLLTRILFDRKHQATAKKAALVQLEVRFDKQRKFMSTGVKVCKGQFKNGRVVCRPDAELLNEKIDTMYKHVNTLFNDCMKKNIPFSLALLDSDTSQYIVINFIDFIERRMKEKRYSDSSMRNLKMFHNFFVNHFGRIRQFSDITTPNIRAFDDFLKGHIGTKTGRPFTTNTIKVYHSLLRMFISDAVSFELIDKNPYSVFKQGRFQTTQRVYLTKEELDTLRSFKCSKPNLQRSLDLFLIQCYTGMAYSDMASTDFSDIEEHGGEYFLPRKTRVKTGTQYYTMLLPPVVEILKRCDFKPGITPYVCYGSHLRAIAKEAEINKHITSHVGRHTFATTVALGSGIPIEVVSKMLGHTNIQTTQIYAKVLPKSVVDGFQQIKNSI